MKKSKNRGFSVALIGRRCHDNINLGLGYLAGALRDAGFGATVHAFNDWRDMEAIARKVMADGSPLVGLAISDGGSAFLPLGLGELLRRMGYRGHITCGGPFATLARKWLLNRYNWLDSVVRFAGEVPIVDLARRICDGSEWEDVPGLTTRNGDGPCHPVCDPTPMTTFPERDFFPTILGYPMTHIAATRGCLGTCSYCGPSSLLSLERREGRRGGLESAELDQNGVGKVRRRSVDHLCNEMAELWHANGVRYFYFVDEHMLPYEEREALEFIKQWKTGLDRRGVGRFGVGTMLRVDHITPRVAEAFAGAGLVRVFLGIEFATSREARRFGRRTDPERVFDLLGTFRRLGVATVSNLMLVHPYSTADSIENGIRFLEELPVGVFQATRMMVYHGTRLQAQMEREQRLVGNPLRYSYTQQCSTVGGFAQVFQRLRTEAFHDYSIVFRAHDAALALALARRLNSETAFGEVSRRLDGIIRSVNDLHVRAYRKALDLVRRKADDQASARECSELVEAAVAEAARLARELDRVAGDIPELIRRPGAVFAPMRAAAASALKFVVVGTALTSALSGVWGCAEPGHLRHVSPPRPEAAASGPADKVPGRPPESKGGVVDSSPVRPKAKQARCTPAQERADKKTVIKKIKKSDKCFSGYIYFKKDGSAQVNPRSPVVYGGYSGFGRTKLMICNNAAMHALRNKKKRRIVHALSGRKARCLFRLRLDVSGKDLGDLAYLRDRLISRCKRNWARFVIAVDSNGRALPVGPRGKQKSVQNDAAARCIRKALKGLKFPCLAGHQICPVHEHVIIE
jgi:radical SAM superfamily enzyme YgiQ (UPF0313 family)